MCRLCNDARERAVHVFTQGEPFWKDRITAFRNPSLWATPQTGVFKGFCSFLSLERVASLENELEVNLP